MKTTTMINGKRNGTVPVENPVGVDVVIDGSSHAAHPGERLVDLINRVGVKFGTSLLSPSARTNSNLRHVSGRDQRPTGPGLCDHCLRGDEHLDGFVKSPCSAAGGV